MTTKEKVIDYIEITKNNIMNSIRDLSFIGATNPIYTIPESENIYDARKNSPHYLAKVWHEIDESFSPICASPKRKKLFESSYVFPSVEDKSININDHKKIREYRENPDSFLTELKLDACA